MSYFGGPSVGYEAGLLSVGIAYTEDNPTCRTNGEKTGQPLVLMATDKDAAWWDNIHHI